MSQSNQTLREVIAAAEQLSVPQQRRIVKHLLEKNTANENAVFVCLQRLTQQKQDRLAVLMDKNNEGELSKSERAELVRLNEEVSRIVLENSAALAQAMRPELFDKQNRLIKSRYQQLVKSARQKKGTPNSDS